MRRLLRNPQVTADDRTATTDGARGRRRRLGNGYIGGLDQTTAFRLAPDLTAPGDLPLADALRRVLAAYATAAAAGSISARTARQYATKAGEFLTFAQRDGAVTLADVDEQTAVEYVFCANAPGSRRPDEPPRLDTMQVRRSGVRALARTARVLGLDDRNLTANLVLPTRTTAEPRALDSDPRVRGPEGRPLTAVEADRCRTASRYRHDDSRLPAAAALALAGAGTAEMPQVLVSHLRLADSLVWCPGIGRSNARWLRLDAWAVEALTDHRRYLARVFSPADLPGTPVTNVGPRRSRRRTELPTGDGGLGLQSEMVQLLRRVLTKAGLAGVEGLRPQSFADYAGARELNRTGRLEAAAVLLGLASLDAAAATLSYPWQDLHRVAAPPSEQP